MLLRCLQNEADPQSAIAWGVTTGTLEQAGGIIEIAGHEHVADTLDSGFSDLLHAIGGAPVERWPHHFHQGEELPLYWTSPAKPQVTPSRNERLRAGCKCGGIEFWIARPSERSAMGQAPWPDVLIPFHASTPPPVEDQAWWLRDGGKKYLAGICSCDSCRLASGDEWVEWAFVPTVDIALDAAGAVPFSREFGTLKHYRSSEEATRHFCGMCGAIVFWDGDARPQLIDVAVGLLHAPEGARAETWLEWQTKRLSFREHAVARAESLTMSVEAGLKAYGELKSEQEDVQGP